MRTLGGTYLCLPEGALVLRVAAAEGAHCQGRRLPDLLRPGTLCIHLQGDLHCALRPKVVPQLLHCIRNRLGRLRVTVTCRQGSCPNWNV